MILERVLSSGYKMKILERREYKEFYHYVDRDRSNSENWVPFVSNTKSEADAENYIIKFLEMLKNGEGYFWGLWDGNTIIGLVLIKDIDKNLSTAEIGYMIDKKYEGKKIVKETCDVMIDFIFNELQLDKIRICCDEENMKSRKFPERYGFKHEGTIRKDIKINGRIGNTMYWGLLKEEYRK